MNGASKPRESWSVNYIVAQVVNHAVEYVRGRVYTNGLENFWSLLNRGIKGTYVSVEPFHLARYIDEQAFRFNYRNDINDGDRFDLAVRQIVGKRLMYRELTGKTQVDNLQPFQTEGFRTIATREAPKCQ